MEKENKGIEEYWNSNLRKKLNFINHTVSVKETAEHSKNEEMKWWNIFAYWNTSNWNVSMLARPGSKV